MNNSLDSKDEELDGFLIDNVKANNVEITID